MPFQWYESLGEYRDAGRFISQREIDGAVDRVIQIGAERMRALTGDLQEGKITVASRQTSMAREIKDLHLGAAMIARGGREQMTLGDWGWTGQRIRVQYQYLREFAADIVSGHAKMEGRLQVRAAMYAAAARGTQREMTRRVASRNGREQERNLLGASDRHCGACVSATAQGWVPIGTLPAIGSRTCLSHCRCSMRYRTLGPARLAA